MSWLTSVQEIYEKAKAITEFREPEEAFNPAKQVQIGEMSNELKGLFTLWRKAGDAVEESMAASEETPSEVVKKAVTQFSVLRDIFWLAVRLEYKLFLAPCVGVTRGFRVVTEEYEEEPKPSRMVEVHIINLSRPN
ncbi:MAG: hypothetical protein V1705_00885 [bacterium]